MKDFKSVGKTVEGNEGEGIVHTLHCSKCGADIEYCVPSKNEEECDE